MLHGFSPWYIRPTRIWKVSCLEVNFPVLFCSQSTRFWAAKGMSSGSYLPFWTNLLVVFCKAGWIYFPRNAAIGQMTFTLLFIHTCYGNILFLNFGHIAMLIQIWYSRTKNAKKLCNPFFLGSKQRNACNPQPASYWPTMRIEELIIEGRTRRSCIWI